MAWYNFNKKKEEVKVEDNPLYSAFSTPFGKIGEGNLSLPYVRSYGSERYVRFGNDNLYPQIINQLYYQSPLHSSIINFKMNAVIGGGFELISNDNSGVQKVKEYSFIRRNKFNKMVKQITMDLIMHGRICIIVDNTGKDVKLERIGPERVRTNKYKNLFTISEDWARSVDIYELKPYSEGLKEKTLYYYEVGSIAGQDIYPIPSYCSALNWCFIDGEMGYLHKSNIINSIFPSFMIKLAKKFGSQEEINQFNDTINKAKGAPAAGRIMTFVANIPEQLPTIEAIPTNQNDKLFEQTDGRIDLQLSRAHSIDPLLVGIRTTGQLGSGTDIQIAYTIFEKNVVMPLREEIKEVIDDLLNIGGLNSTVEINNYQIVDNVIVDKTDKNNGDK